MKKLFISTLVLLSIGFSAFTASANDDYPSSKELNNSSTNISWKYTADFHKASMAIQGKTTEYFYSPAGEFLASSRSFDFDKLPAAALKTLTSSYAYPAYALEECIEIVNADQQTNYYLSLIKSNKKTILQIATDGTVSNISGN